MGKHHPVLIANMTVTELIRYGYLQCPEHPRAHEVQNDLIESDELMDRVLDGTAFDSDTVEEVKVQIQDAISCLDVDEEDADGLLVAPEKAEEILKELIKFSF